MLERGAGRHGEPALRAGHLEGNVPEGGDLVDIGRVTRRPDHDPGRHGLENLPFDFDFGLDPTIRHVVIPVVAGSETLDRAVVGGCRMAFAAEHQQATLIVGAQLTEWHSNRSQTWKLDLAVIKKGLVVGSRHRTCARLDLQFLAIRRGVVAQSDEVRKFDAGRLGIGDLRCPGDLDVRPEHDLVERRIAVIGPKPKSCRLPLDTAGGVFETTGRGLRFPGCFGADEELVRAIADASYSDGWMDADCGNRHDVPPWGARKV